MPLHTPATTRALDGACSTLSRALDEPTAGTAPYARAWLVIEQPGPWGRDAVRESHLDREVAHALAEAAEALPVRVLLARRPGRHADLPGARRVWTAFTEPGRTWLRETVVEDAAALLDTPLESLARGEAPGSWNPAERPLLFVCTNSRRDRCCALRGRPLAARLARRHPGRVWECSHLSGHRFAPTALVLPHGLVYGRVDESRADRVLADADGGQVSLEGYRGRTCYSAAAQVAEAHVRATSGDADADAVRVLSTVPSPDGSQRVRVAAPRSREWEVTVGHRKHPQSRPESCGKPAAELVSVVVTGARRTV